MSDHEDDITAVYGIFGWPVRHSRSPTMHNAAFKALNLDAVYVPFPVQPERLAQAVEGARALGTAGLNITLPHKSAIMALLDEVESDARAIGAVNTVLREGDQLIGTNTDAGGLTRSLREAGLSLEGCRVVVLGAGGAARAAVVGLASAGAERITVLARQRSRATQLVDSLASHAGQARLAARDMADGARALFEDSDLLVQATSATLGGGPAAAAFADALPLAALPQDAAVVDLVYQPRLTAVLSHAAARGLKTVDGLGMLLHQGALAFERWTGRDAPLAVMRAALEAE